MHYESCTDFHLLTQHNSVPTPIRHLQPRAHQMEVDDAAGTLACVDVATHRSYSKVLRVTES